MSVTRHSTSISFMICESTPPSASPAGVPLSSMRHGHFDLFIQRDAGEIDVNHFDAQVIVLHFLDQHLFALAGEREIEEMSAFVQMKLTTSFFGSVTGTTASLWP